jgi:short-subunit dehydrogenase
MSKHIVITGASRGIGYQSALYLAQKGHQVLALARSTQELQTLENKSDNITSLPTDLTEKNDLNKVYQSVQDNFAPLHILINCAGALVNKSFDKLEYSDWQKMFDVNLMAPVQLVKELLPTFSYDSHILNISSMAGYQGSAKFPGLSAYSSTKGALSVLTECIASEYAENGISCNALCLGMVQTEMLEEAFPGVEAPVSASKMGTYVANFALTGHELYNGQILPVNRQDPS